jgi:hypothetical protein
MDDFYVCEVLTKNGELLASWRLTATNRDAAYSEAGAVSRMISGWRDNSVRVTQHTQQEWEDLEEILPETGGG